MIRHDLDKTLFSSTKEEVQILNERRAYYPEIIGRFFQNKIFLVVYKYTRNIFSNMDPNMYFFANHPRERGNISDFEKFSPLLIPAFIIGIFLNIKKNLFIFFYFLITIMLSGLFDVNSYLGPILLFPLICILISQGALYIVYKLNR